MVKSKAVELTSEAVNPVTVLLVSSKLKVKSSLEGEFHPFSYTGVEYVIISLLVL